MTRKLIFTALAIAAVGTTTGLASAQGMQAGGLEPPPPLPPEDTPPPASATEERLESSRKSDSGRGLEWLWLEAEGGVSHVGLQTFNIDEKNFSAGFIPTTATGAMIGAAVGARLIFLTLGVRGRVGFYDAWDIFSVGGELGFRIPLGNLEPHFDLGGGYTALGSYKSAVENGNVQAALDTTQIRGFYVRASGGLDYYVTPVFSIGASATFEVLALTRPGADPTKLTQLKADPSLTDAQKTAADALALEGSSVGAAVGGTAVLGLHF